MTELSSVSVVGSQHVGNKTTAQTDIWDASEFVAGQVEFDNISETIAQLTDG